MLQTQKYVYIHKWINKLFSEENNKTLFEARKMAASVTYKQSKTG